VTVIAIPDRADATGARRGVGVVGAGFCVAGAPVAGFCVAGAGVGAGGGAGFCCGGEAGAWAKVVEVMKPTKRQLDSSRFRIGSIIVPSMGIIPNGRQGYPGR